MTVSTFGANAFAIHQFAFFYLLLSSLFYHCVYCYCVGLSKVFSKRLLDNGPVFSSTHLIITVLSSNFSLFHITVIRASLDESAIRAVSDDKPLKEGQMFGVSS